MKIQHIDELFITLPMAEAERFKLLESFKTEAFLEGIDKGTLLERDTITRLNQIKEKNFNKKYLSIIERLNDYIYVGVRRHKRKKYRGRYDYPKKDKHGNIRKKKSKIMITYTNLPSWLQ
jgi:hypothetical protein